MNAIGSIRAQSVLAERVRELALQRSVSEVSNDEALNGASQSDSIRFASREQNQDGNTVPLKVYLQRINRFQAKLKNKKADKAQEHECPVEKARAESATGANAPLNWLTPDQFGGQSEKPPASQDSDDGVAPKLQAVQLDDGLVSYSAPVVNEEPSSLLQGEWLFSPAS